MTKAFDQLAQGDHFAMTISWTGKIVHVEVDVPAARRVGDGLMLRGHIVGTSQPVNAFGKAGAHDQRTLVA